MTATDMISRLEFIPQTLTVDGLPAIALSEAYTEFEEKVKGPMANHVQKLFRTSSKRLPRLQPNHHHNQHPGIARKRQMPLSRPERWQPLASLEPPTVLVQQPLKLRLRLPALHILVSHRHLKPISSQR